MPLFYRLQGWKLKDTMVYAISLILDGLTRIFTLGRYGCDWQRVQLTKHLLGKFGDK